VKELLRLNQVSLQRRGVGILQQVSWIVGEGQRWVVLGANGCGKSTLLRVIQGYEWPGEGSVHWRGTRYGDGVDIPFLRRSMGWVASHLDREFDPSLSALEVVLTGEGARLAHFQAMEPELIRRGTQLLTEAGLAELANRPYGVLSTGQRQRVLMMRALIATPALLLLDEPCAGLDPVARHGFLRGLSHHLHHAGNLTVVYVTHHVEEILVDFSHLLLMKDGKVLYGGSLSDGLTSQSLSKVYGVSVCLLPNSQGGWFLEVSEGSDRIRR
jgi:iron complex transport system ATP-binding protein